MNIASLSILATGIILVLSCSTASAVTMEVAAGAWYQCPNGSVAYTYNVLDVMDDEAHDIVSGLLPFDDTFLERLHDNAHDLFHRYFPSTYVGRALDDLFTRTDELDFVDDCNFEPVLRPSGRVRILISPLVNFSFMATPLEFRESGDMRTSFYFLDVLFEPATEFDSRLRLTHYDVAWFADLSPIAIDDHWGLHTEAGLNVRIVDFYAGISQEATGLAASTSRTLPLPMLYLAVQFTDRDTAALEIEARGTRYSNDYVYDIIGRLRYRIAGPLHLAAGFRHLYVDLDINDLNSDGTFSGPFMETVLSF